MPLVLINPQITLRDGTEIGSEGCLSFPEITGDIERATSINVRAQDLNGNEIEFEASGLLSRAIQHEVDHLNGILFIDRMNSATKASIASKLKRMQKETLRVLRKDRQAVAL
jgi:peptide deformylase